MFFSVLSGEVKAMVGLVFLLIFLTVCDGGKEKAEMKKLPLSSSSHPEALAVKRENVSTIAKFLTEPELGTSWYDPSGPSPTFLSDQSNGTSYSARLGSDALLDCRVTSLERDLVSWCKKDKYLPVLLTVGFKPHSAENRKI
jgi:hypothetical protein